MIRRLLLVLALLLPTPLFAQVVAQGAPATTSDAKAWPVKIIFGDTQVDPRAPTATDGVSIATGQTSVLNLSLLHYYNPDTDVWQRVGDGTNGTQRLPVGLIETESNDGSVFPNLTTNTNISFLYVFDGSNWVSLPGNDSAGLRVQGAMQLFDGSTTATQQAHSAANDSTTIITSMAMAAPVATWCVNHTPAAATQATVSRAAAPAGVRHVVTTYQACFAAGATAGPVQTWAVRDGATGAGTVIWSGALAAPVNGSSCVSGAINKAGSTATAATIEFGAAGAATTVETVSMCGYDVQ